MFLKSILKYQGISSDPSISTSSPLSTRKYKVSFHLDFYLIQPDFSGKNSKKLIINPFHFTELVNLLGNSKPTTISNMIGSKSQFSIFEPWSSKSDQINYNDILFLQILMHNALVKLGLNCDHFFRSIYVTV